MSEERRRYEELIQALMERASARELDLLYRFTRAFLGESEEVRS
jgi:hypothetical protein